MAGRRIAGNISFRTLTKLVIQKGIMETQFRNRHAAGRFLAGKLKHLANNPGLIVLALPRGGVPVAYEIARELNAPLDIFIVRKLGVPIYEELAMGAIA